MRETRLSGSMSGNRKQSHAKPDCGGQAKASQDATGRLQSLRLFSTLPRTVAFADVINGRTWSATRVDSLFGQ